MSTASQITNEDVLEAMQELVQMTGDGFENNNAKLDEHSRILAEYGRILEEHSKLLAEHSQSIASPKQEIKEIRTEGEVKAITQDLSTKHSASISDISNILDRIIVELEKQSRLAKAELQELQKLLQTVAGWATRAAEALRIPLELRS